MFQKSQSNDDLSRLRRVLLSPNLATWQIMYLWPRTRTRGTVLPGGIEDRYSHNMIMRVSAESDQRVAELLRAIEGSTFTNIEGSVDIRLKMQFQSEDGKILFVFHTNEFCNRGYCDGHYFVIKGPLVSWLLYLTKRCFDW